MVRTSRDDPDLAYEDDRDARMEAELQEACEHDWKQLVSGPYRRCLKCDLVRRIV